MKELIELIELIEKWQSDLETLKRDTTSKWEIARLEQCITELEEAMKPRPIESAPRDGSPVMVLFKGIGWRVCTWETPHYMDDLNDEDSKIWCIDDNKNGPVPMRGYCDGDDTHWLPLPTIGGEE